MLFILLTLPYLILPFLVLQAMPSYRWLVAGAVLGSTVIWYEVWYYLFLPFEDRHEGNGFIALLGLFAAWAYVVSFIAGIAVKAVVLHLKQKGVAFRTRFLAACAGFMVLLASPWAYIAADALRSGWHGH